MSAQRAVLSPKNVQILFPCGKKALDIALAEESFLIITHSPGFFHCNLLKSQSKFSLYSVRSLFAAFISRQNDHFCIFTNCLFDILYLRRYTGIYEVLFTT